MELSTDISILARLKDTLSKFQVPRWEDILTGTTAIPTTELTNLNHDCLAEIFRRLDINDLYAIACAHPLFKNVFTLFNRRFEYTVTDIDAPNLLDFFQRIGMQISTLYITIGERCRNSAEVIEFLECVQMHCANVKHLTVKKWSNLNFSRLAVLLMRLESLELIECNNVEPHHPDDGGHFSFRVWTNPQSDADRTCLIHLTNLKTLKLHTCKGFRPHHFYKFLQMNGKLTELSLFALAEFKQSERFFDDLANNLQELETICIDVQTTSNIQFIANLPKLRTLHLLDYSVHNDRIVDRLLRSICDSETIEELDLYHCHLGQITYRFISQLKNLHTLKLRKNFWIADQHLQSLTLMPALKTVCFFDNVILTDDGVLSIVKMAPKLNQLDISWCFMISNQTIHDIQLLMQAQMHRPKLCVLAGGRTKIKESVMDVSIASKIAMAMNSIPDFSFFFFHCFP